MTTKDCDVLGFKPPKMNVPLIRIAQTIYPTLLKLRYGQFTYEVESGLEKVKSLGTNRVVLCPNHPSLMDMDTAFLISVILDEPLYFMCAREIFKGSFFNERLLQFFGCYSILRGTADRSAYTQALDILTAGRHKLVLFPEGEISNSNSLLLPMRSGAAHLAIKAASNLGQGLETQGPPVYLVPLALKYRYPHLSARTLLKAIESMEASLNIKGVTDDQSMHLRVIRIGEGIVTGLLSKYGCRLATGSLTQRIVSLRRCILDHLANYVGIHDSCTEDEVAHAHRIWLELYKARWYEHQLESKLDYQRHHERYQLLDALMHDYHLVMKFLAVGKVSLQPDLDDMINLLMLIHKEVLPHEPLRLPVHLQIAFGDPILSNSFCSSQLLHQTVEQLLMKKVEQELKSSLITLRASLA